MMTIKMLWKLMYKMKKIYVDNEDNDDDDDAKVY